MHRVYKNEGEKSELYFYFWKPCVKRDMDILELDQEADARGNRGF